MLVLSSLAFLLLTTGITTDLSSLGVVVIMLLIFAVAAISAIFGLFSKSKWWQALVALIFILLTSKRIIFT